MTSNDGIDNGAYNNVNPEKYTVEELAEFYDRLEKYDAGEMPVYSIEEAHNYVRLQKKVK